MKPVAIPRTLKEIAVMKMAPEFNSAWKKYLSKHKELGYKKNREYMLMINLIAKRNFTQNGELNIDIAHNEGIDLFTE